MIRSIECTTTGLQVPVCHCGMVARISKHHMDHDSFCCRRRTIEATALPPVYKTLTFLGPSLASQSLSASWGFTSAPQQCRPLRGMQCWPLSGMH